VPSPVRPETRALDTALDVLAGRPLVALTGAGLSTDSGIPDYRGPASPKRTPMTYTEFVSGPLAQRRYWARSHVGWARMARALPNPGHHALAALEASGVLHGVITQNVDGLHRAAGSRNPLELHGTLAEVECLDCGFRAERQRAAAQLAAGAPVPLCAACGSNLKPAVVLFGELLPPAFDEAHRELASCDLLICCGTTLRVYPVAAIPELVHANGGPVGVVNLGPTGADHIATVRLDARTGDALPALVGLLGPAPAHNATSL